MIVYVESDFVIRIALRQTDCDFADSLLVHAESGRVALKIPAFSLMEPFSTVGYHKVERRKAEQELARLDKYFMQSRLHEKAAAALSDLRQFMAAATNAELLALKDPIERLLKIASVMPTRDATIRSASSLAKDLGISMQDAVVLSSVLHDLRRQPKNSRKFFVSGNWTDFDQKEVLERLRELGCIYTRSCQTVQSVLNSSRNAR